MHLFNKLKTVYSKFTGKNLLLIGIILHLLASPVYAQSNFFEATPQEHETALEQCAQGNVGLECTVQAILTGIGNSLSYGGLGEIQQPGAPALPRRPGALHFAGSMIGTLIAQRPISSGDYVQYIARRLNPVEPAYAQGGTGYDALLPVMNIWTAFRNVAYLAFVVIFIFIGFMIMFRARLDPQTVVNIQNSLPKLVVTLLLITFSYAIAGFLVDLIYLGIYLLVAIFSSQGLIENAGPAREALLSNNVFQIIMQGGIWRGGSQLATEAIQNIVVGAFEKNEILNTLFGGDLANWLAHTVIIVALLFSMFKLFFQLLIAYVSIIISTLFAPIMILFNALPGSQSFGNWIRNLLANVLVFPAVAAIFLISAILMGPADPSNPEAVSWGIQTSQYEQYVSPDTPGWVPPFLAFSADTDAVLSLIGLGFILLAPQMVSLVQQALKAKPLPMAGVFAPIAAGAALTGGAVRVAASPLTAPARGAVGMGRTFVSGAVGQLGENIFGERVRGRGPGPRR